MKKPNLKRPDDNTQTLASLPILLLRARVAVAGCYRGALRKYDFTEQQWRVLRILLRNSPFDVTELAMRADLLPSSLSRILRDLTERGLLARSVPHADGRRVLAMLTDEGRESVKRVLGDVEPIHAEIEQRLGAKRTMMLRELLDELTESLKRDPPGGD